MLKLPKIRRALVMTTVTLALATGTTLATTNAAHADGGTCTGNWHYIGNPGDYYYYGVYAGQVEQMWDSSCNEVVAHWQWSNTMQTLYPDVPVCVSISSPYATVASTTQFPCPTARYQKDVYSSNWVHNANPDDWYATAAASLCGGDAKGTYHSYGGWDIDGPHTGGCDRNGVPK